MNFEEIVKIFGISSVISIIVTYIFDFLKNKQKFRFEKLTLEKENRYRSILIFMQVVLDPENQQHVETAFTCPNNDSSSIKKYFIKELSLNLDFCYLFASKNVIKQLEEFIQEPNPDNFKKVALAMRADLWNDKL